MTGRAEVSEIKRRLDATFDRAEDVASDSELQADLARYLCMLVSGYAEPSSHRALPFDYPSLARSTRRKFPLRILPISSSEYPRSSKPLTNCW